MILESAVLYYLGFIEQLTDGPLFSYSFLPGTLFEQLSGDPEESYFVLHGNLEQLTGDPGSS
jgi:hypothetical protein